MIVETISSEEMAVADENSEYLGTPRILLMENAGRAVAEHLKEHFKDLRGKFVTVFCGTGNNGGDGMVAARHLAGYGCKVLVVFLGSPDKIRTYEANVNFAAINSMKATVEIVVTKDVTTLESLADRIKNSDAIVDGIFGTGIKGEIREPWLTAIKQINALGRYVVAIDVPSGIDPDTGEIAGTSVKADTTITFHRIKPGLLTEQGKKFSGKLIVSSIGMPPEAELIAGPGDLRVATTYMGKDGGRLGVILDEVTDENVILLRVCGLMCKEVGVLGQFVPHGYHEHNVKYMTMEEFIDSIRTFSTVFLEGDVGRDVLTKVIGYDTRAKIFTHSYELANLAKKHLSVVLALTSEDIVSLGLSVQDVFKDIKSVLDVVKDLSRKLSMPIGVIAEIDGISDGNAVKANWLLEPIRDPVCRYLYFAIASALLSWGTSAIRSLSAASFVARSVTAKLSQTGKTATPENVLSALMTLLNEMKLSYVLQNRS
ncbi:MAG: NAD(P)H-hydrate epimerase [Nitrososphaerota archaeon]|nr:NAD(P)H-hydrate epimerase [Aigarchaeota archaeon]MDW8076761.1 NAD(P)H-hydrate epimerase [Nitrososphaerota archaeon]